MAVKFTSSLLVNTGATGSRYTYTIFIKTPMYKYAIFIREYNCVHINISNIPIVFIVYIYTNIVLYLVYHIYIYNSEEGREQLDRTKNAF